MIEAKKMNAFGESLRFYVLLVALFFITGALSPFITAAAAANAPVQSTAAVPSTATDKVNPVWQPLMDRLAADGLAGKDINNWFAALDDGYSEKPMGIMMGALFRTKYMPPPFEFLRKPVKAPDLLPDVFTEGNVELCAEFMLKHAQLLSDMTRDYKVEADIVVALFMVETRLGTYMGHEHAFWSLACMSMADGPGKIQTYLDKLPTTPERLKWVSEQMDKRSEWAYRELKALIEYCRLYGHDPLAITGSPFGAIGLPQFMPTNIPAYAADGNKDGIIDLFALEDGLPSIARFLLEHGWQFGLSKEEQHKIVRRYNHSDAYANTVLALAEATRKHLAELALEADAAAPNVKKAASDTQKSQSGNSESIDKSGAK